jgi:hypothetical protein
MSLMLAGARQRHCSGAASHYAECSASKGTRIKMGRHSAWTPKHLAVRPIAKRPRSLNAVEKDGQRSGPCGRPMRLTARGWGIGSRKSGTKRAGAERGFAAGHHCNTERETKSQNPRSASLHNFCQCSNGGTSL